MDKMSQVMGMGGSGASSSLISSSRILVLESLSGIDQAKSTIKDFIKHWSKNSGSGSSVAASDVFYGRSKGNVVITDAALLTLVREINHENGNNSVEVDTDESFVNIPTSLHSFAIRSEKPSIIIKSLMTASAQGDKELAKLGLALVARGCFYSNAVAFEQLESLVDSLNANRGYDAMAQGFSGTAYPINSPLIKALSQATSLPHSSCVALGTIKEAEVARARGSCPAAMVGRLSRLFKELNLPNKFDRRIIDPTAVRLAFLNIANVQPRGQVDVMLPTGSFILERPMSIPVATIERVISDALTVVPFELSDSNRNCSVRVPGSKSVSNRALLLAGLGKGSCTVRGLLHSDDTQVMMCALEQLGATFTWVENGAALLVKGNGGKFANPTKPLWMGNAGTATRFVISLCCLVADPNHETIMEGSHRMEERPQRDLIDALLENGSTITYKKNEGYLPLAVKGGGFRGGKMTMSGKISSQYVSSVLFASPYAKEPLELTLAEAEPTSISYIEMTVATMAEFGVHVERLAINKFRVPNDQGYICPAEYFVEADASSATYALACASVTPNRSVTVLGVGSDSLQGDAEFCGFLKKMGAKVEQTRDATTVTGPESLLHSPHEPNSSIDMSSLTDAFLTGCACAAVTPEGNTTKIVGIANQHVKECDRIAALVKELGKCGVSCDNLPDGIVVRGKGSSFTCPSGEVYLDTYDDHRVAMSFAVVGCRVPSLVISDKDCTDKTYPDFWDDLENHLKTTVQAHPSSSSLINRVWQNQSLVLIGMRGAGKSTLGKKAAVHLGWTFLDMDDVITKKAGLDTCKAIVEKLGWAGFRQLEFQVLSETLRAHPEKYVLACGGGVVEIPESRNLLKSWFPVINIERDFADIDLVLTGGPSPSKRVKQDAQAGVVVEDPNRPRFDEPIENVWQRRKPWFKECSNFDFYSLRSGTVEALTEDWPFIEKDFTRFLDNARKSATPDSFLYQPDLVFMFDIDPNQVKDLDMLKLRVSDARKSQAANRLLCVRILPTSTLQNVEHEVDLLINCGRYGIEGLVFPSKTRWKHSAIHRGRVLASFPGPVRCGEDAVETDQTWYRAAALLYPGKTWFQPVAEKMYYLFGHPVYASPSPTMHNEAFALLGHTDNKKHYSILNSDDADRINHAISSKIFAGASVTIPHKQNIRNIAHLSSEAKAIGAVNTLVRLPNGELAADNTDWIGIRNCLLYKGPVATSGSILVVGAGGTARAACYCVKSMGLSLLVYNRTASKADELASEFGGRALKDSTDVSFARDIKAIVSTVPASSGWTAPEFWLSAAKPLVLDVAYRPRRTSLLNQAQSLGCHTVEGIDMLLEQGFEQVKRFQCQSIDKQLVDQVTLSEEMKQRIRKVVFEFYDKSG